MKPKLLSIVFTLLATFQFASLTNGQEKKVGAAGTEIPLHQQHDDASGKYCYVYEKYVVKTAPSQEEGDDIFVFRHNAATDYKKACAETNALPLMSVIADDNNFFHGLTGNLFFIDSGTSAGERGLDIFSLVSKKKVFSTSYMNDAKVVGSTVIYDKPSDQKGSLKTCPNYRKWRKMGGGEGWVRPMRIDLTTFKETAAGALKCVYLE